MRAWRPCRPRYGVKPTIALECDSAQVICQAVLEGLGAAAVSRNFVRRYGPRGLSAVRIADGSLRRRIVLLRPHGSDSAVMRGSAAPADGAGVPDDARVIVDI
jgi:DNA-binding transcriptional LysR family regulator